MTLAAMKLHPIFLGGRWVESVDVLEVTNPALPDELAGTTYNATDEQYEDAVEAAIRAFEVTRRLPAYERGASGDGQRSGATTSKGGDPGR
jgi:acyl-CoA reductase-like NAD-dependent aldehyde dehydrogenase